MTNGTETGRGFFNRKITMKWALLLIELALLAGLVLWMFKAFELRGLARNYDSAMREQATQTAQVTARSIATFGNRQIVQADWGAVQDAADQVVSQKPLAYVAILDAKGIAVVHTNGSQRGKKLSEGPPTEGVIEASVPAMSATSQVATVRVGVNIGQR